MVRIKPHRRPFLPNLSGQGSGYRDVVLTCRPIQARINGRIVNQHPLAPVSHSTPLRAFLVEYSNDLSPFPGRFVVFLFPSFLGLHDNISTPEARRFSCAPPSPCEFFRQIEPHDVVSLPIPSLPCFPGPPCQLDQIQFRSFSLFLSRPDVIAL